MKPIPLTDLIRRASQALNVAYMAREPPATLTQALVLRGLAKSGPLNQAKLIEITGVDRSTLSEMLRRMASAGLLTTSRLEKDRRNIIVSITPKGRSVLLKVDRTLSDAETRIMMLVPSDLRMLFRKALQAIAEGAEA